VQQRWSGSGTEHILSAYGMFNRIGIASISHAGTVLAIRPSLRAIQTTESEALFVHERFRAIGFLQELI
jgi:hypothetical protein